MDKQSALGEKNVNKTELIDIVAETADLPKKDATKAVDCVFSAITDALKSGAEVKILGFGTFSVSKREAGQGRNPRTGEIIEISAANQPKFKAGKGLKDALN